MPVKDVLTYEQKVKAAKNHIMAMAGDTVTAVSGNNTMLWRVIKNHVVVCPERDTRAIGLKPNVLKEVMEDPEMVASSIFMKLMFGQNFVPYVVRMNRAIQRYNDDSEFLCCIALLIGSI